MTTRIDVHHHVIPDVYQEAIEQVGVQIKGVDPIYWSEESDIEVMDRNGIQTAILSVTAPGGALVDGQAAEDLVRRTNDEIAEIKSHQPGRYGAFAVIPATTPEASITEIDRAIDDLGFDGVGLFSNFRGVYLGDEELEPVLAHIAQRDLVAFVHPAVPVSNQRDFGLPPSLYEFTFDTTRAVANMLYAGTLDRLPNIKLILSHAGGTVPFLAKRMTYGSTIASRLKDSEPKDILASLRRLYYDTAMSANPYTLSALQALIPDDHILFGSDFPYMPESTTKESIEGMAFFSDDTRLKVERSNAERLFPQFVAD